MDYLAELTDEKEPYLREKIKAESFDALCLLLFYKVLCC